jgi:transcriptional regulator with XRE-family HTH domain
VDIHIRVQIDMEERVARTPNRIRQFREQLGITQTELAEKAAISQSTIARVEAGQPIKFHVAERIAAALGKSVSAIFPEARSAIRRISKSGSIITASMADRVALSTAGLDDFWDHAIEVEFPNGGELVGDIPLSEWHRVRELMREKTSDYYSESKSSFIELGLVDSNLILNLSAVRAINLVEDAYKPLSDDLPGLGEERPDILIIYLDSQRVTLGLELLPTFPSASEMPEVPEEELMSYEYFDIVMSLVDSAPFVHIGNCDGDCSADLFVRSDQVAAIVVSNHLIYKGWADKFSEIYDAEEADSRQPQDLQEKTSKCGPREVDASQGN